MNYIKQSQAGIKLKQQAIEMMKKQCSNCFQFKPATTEHFYRKGKSELQSRCIKCNPEVCNGYQKRKKEKEIDNRWKKIYST